MAANALYGELYVVVVQALLDGVAYIERLSALDIFVVSVFIKGDSVDDASRHIIDQFESEMFLIATYQTTRTVIVHVASEEDGFFVSRSEWIEVS